MMVQSVAAVEKVEPAGLGLLREKKNHGNNESTVAVVDIIPAAVAVGVVERIEPIANERVVVGIIGRMASPAAENVLLGAGVTVGAAVKVLLVVTMMEMANSQASTKPNVSLLN